MVLRKADLTALRGALGAAVVCLLLSALMLGASHLFWEQMHSEYTVAHARFRDASRKYLSVDEDERVITEYQPTFVELYRRGIVGAEHRLSWVETLTAAGAASALPDLAYKIDAQQVYSPEPPLATGPFDVHVSAMHLSLGLLHEGDLARLLAALDSNAQGLYRVAACELSREATARAVADPAAARLRAECTLEWFTLALRGGPEIRL